MQVDWRRLRIVSALGTGQLIAFGTSLYLLTALSKPIVADTGWNFAWVISGFSIGTLVSATVSAQAGRFIGAGQGRLVLSLSAVLFAVGLFLIALSQNLVMYVIAWGVMGLAMGSGLYDAAFGTAGRLFGATGRSAIIQIALWGGFASTTFWPLSHFLEVQFGWRTTCLIFAGIHLAVCLPLYLFAVPRPADAASVARRPHAAVRVEGIEARIYMALATVVTLEMALVSVISVHMHAVLTGRGLSMSDAVALSAMVGPSQVCARMLDLTLGRRWPPYASMLAGIAALTVGIVMIAAASGLSIPALVLYGAGVGIVSITSGTVPLAIFGPERYPPLMGRIRRLGSVVQAAAPFAAAGLLAQFGVMMLLLMLIGMALVSLGIGLYLARQSHVFLQSRT
ncbi:MULTISPECIES: MFS transporter [Asticcacaulis]|uniref:MFS transporter n=1 Tax=Asticcacaulis TaxID=76890 RepID=UPI001AEB37AB|nr:MULTISPECIES: MFS transporter [Asticcacaulis]MBP2158399.1 MFS family permease [Asticcacaulis solisilvae]MDR6799444.1 MFS family permease [Asticcacaulis sp. BE141]